MTGEYGPNSDGHACRAGRRAAREVRRAAEEWKYGYGGAPVRALSSDHALWKALAALAEFDKMVCVYANEAHDEALFDPLSI